MQNTANHSPVMTSKTDMKTQITPTRLSAFKLFGVSAFSFLLSVLAAPAASLTFSAPANWTADSDVKVGGGGQLFAYTWGNATTVNGLPFTSTTVSSGTVGPNLSLATFTGAS